MADTNEVQIAGLVHPIYSSYAQQKLKTVSAKASSGFFVTGPTYKSNMNIWSPDAVDKLAFDTHKTFANIIKDTRFYYRHDSLASSVINKMVDLAINGLVVDRGSATKTELQIFEALKVDLLNFLRKAALEYLITGLVVPEISLTRIGMTQLRDKGIQRLDSLLYPTDMWLRDAKDIEIKKPFITAKETYFLIIPDDVIHFIQTKGVYPDGTEDKELYREILRLYPEFVAAVQRGETKVKLDNPLIIKSTELADSQYPIPYLSPALESFKHKRNLKRMDYSIAARVISAILHVTAGSDDYPLTEDQEDFLDDLENKFRYRQSLTGDDIERVFTLFTNHTVAINWIFPEVTALLDDKKYESVNKDIIIALGFPRILITGETDRSFASDPEIATLSPVNSLRVMRTNLLPIVRKVFAEMRHMNNNISTYPTVKFQPINLMSLRLFYEGLDKLYESGNLSRESYAEAYGYDLLTEYEKQQINEEVRKEMKLPEFAPVPHSNEPGGAPAGNKNSKKG